jgi:hypothetical protein
VAGFDFADNARITIGVTYDDRTGETYASTGLGLSF